jgi:hypothetical protein
MICCGGQFRQYGVALGSNTYLWSSLVIIPPGILQPFGELDSIILEQLWFAWVLKRPEKVLEDALVFENGLLLRLGTPS